MVNMIHLPPFMKTFQVYHQDSAQEKRALVNAQDPLERPVPSAPPEQPGPPNTPERPTPPDPAEQPNPTRQPERPVPSPSPEQPDSPERPNPAPTPAPRLSTPRRYSVDGVA